MKKEKKDRRICRCECGGIVRGVEDFGRLFTYCDRCSPVVEVNLDPQTLQRIGSMPVQNPADLLEVCQTILQYQERGDPAKDVIEQSAYSLDELIHELALFYVTQQPAR